MSGGKDRPGVVAPPPVIFLAAFAIGSLFHRFVPYYQSFLIAGIFGAAGAILVTWALIMMVRAHTHVDPYMPSTTVVTNGPYRFSRNPIYLALNLLYIAFCLSIGLTSSLILLPIANVVLLFGVIRREERYLEAKFGDVYRTYRLHVRRWL